MTHNDEHLEECKALAVDALAAWRRDNAGKAFTLQQLVADLTEDDRSVYMLVYSEEGARIYLRCTFQEWRFDYEAFSRREWSRALRDAVTEPAAP